MSVITNALTYTWKTKHWILFYKFISQSDKFFKTCPIPHQKIDLSNSGFGQMRTYNYAFCRKRVNFWNTYFSHFLLPFSTVLVVMTIAVLSCCQTIFQKSAVVLGRGPWEGGRKGGREGGREGGKKKNEKGRQMRGSGVVQLPNMQVYKEPEEPLLNEGVQLIGLPSKPPG